MCSSDLDLFFRRRHTGSVLRGNDVRRGRDRTSFFLQPLRGHGARCSHLFHSWSWQIRLSRRDCRFHRHNWNRSFDPSRFNGRPFPGRRGISRNFFLANDDHFLGVRRRSENGNTNADPGPDPHERRRDKQNRARWQELFTGVALKNQAGCFGLICTTGSGKRSRSSSPR